MRSITHIYLLNEVTLAYIENSNPQTRLKHYLSKDFSVRHMSRKEWEAFLSSMGITSKDQVKLATEAALYANLLEKGIPKNLGIHSDDASQFNIFEHSLCFIHEERHYRKLMVSSEETQQLIERVLDEFWLLYKDLKAYKISPDENKKAALEKQFDDLFLQTTTSHLLNERLKKTYKKKG